MCNARTLYHFWYREILRFRWAGALGFRRFCRITFWWLGGALHLWLDILAMTSCADLTDLAGSTNWLSLATLATLTALFGLTHLATRANLTNLASLASSTSRATRRLLWRWLRQQQCGRRRLWRRWRAHNSGRFIGDDRFRALLNRLVGLLSGQLEMLPLAIAGDDVHAVGHRDFVENAAQLIVGRCQLKIKEIINLKCPKKG